MNNPGRYFRRVATFPVFLNCDVEEETVAEIVAATEDGNTLIYTDAALEVIGFVDIEDPSNPQPAGTIAVKGEPTSVGSGDDEVGCVCFQREWGVEAAEVVGSDPAGLVRIGRHQVATGEWTFFYSPLSFFHSPGFSEGVISSRPQTDISEDERGGRKCSRKSAGKKGRDVRSLREP